MFRSLFNHENPLMITIGQITDCIFLTLFWLLGCFPVVTAGAATAALYDSVWREFRKGEKHSWQRFLHSFRQNLKSGLIPTVIFLLLSAVLLWGGIQAWNGAVYGRRSGVCLETQYYPDAVNHPEWAQPFVKAGEPYHSETKYIFA